MARLAGKVIVVTGAGSGIGRATAQKLAKEGAKVVAADINEQSATDTVRMLRDAGGEASAVKADVSKAGDVEAMVGFAVKTYGRLDGAFNNAGIGGPAGFTADHDIGHFEKVVSVNLTGVFMCLKFEIAQMIRQGGGGAIVNISSAGGLMAVPGQTAYSATKHGVIGLTKTAAVEYAAAGVRVNAVCPGIVATEATKSLIPKEVESQILSAQPTKRMAQPSEIADTVCWLMSSESSYVTGVALPIDGGLLAQ